MSSHLLKLFEGYYLTLSSTVQSRSVSEAERVAILATSHALATDLIPRVNTTLTANFGVPEGDMRPFVGRLPQIHENLTLDFCESRAEQLVQTTIGWPDANFSKVVVEDWATMRVSSYCALMMQNIKDLYGLVAPSLARAAQDMVMFTFSKSLMSQLATRAPWNSTGGGGGETARRQNSDAQQQQHAARELWSPRSRGRSRMGSSSDLDNEHTHSKVTVGMGGLQQLKFDLEALEAHFKKISVQFTESSEQRSLMNTIFTTAAQLCCTTTDEISKLNRDWTGKARGVISPEERI
eukprot:c18703_g1_i4.p1 GENE.c18703_g1_i4~~c18703_g1_i4.p1  ORF type:complete len:294 (+),score=69.95 c18703_g1_i4:544-1425(+)